MATVIYPSPIFGPVHSRRLGISLGINLLPADGKVCTFDCIYCECGFNKDFRARKPMPTRQEVYLALQEQLQKMKSEGQQPDVLTFAGNGEPTIHPDFPAIIDDTRTLRDRYFPQARISVLSNATRILKPEVFEALKKVDNNILKLDTVDPEYIQRVDRPTGPYDLTALIAQMKAFDGKVIIQTMFMTGSMEGQDVDNTTDYYVEPWLQTIKEIAPAMVMIYTIDRETPDHDLAKATAAQLDRIAERVREAGISVSVSY